MPYDGGRIFTVVQLASMTPRRFLCSQLVALSDYSSETGGGRLVNLEEIWAGGAILEAETAVTSGSQVELRCGSAVFRGRIVEVQPHEFGWRFEVEFSPKTRWRLEDFRPDHLLDPSAVGKKSGEETG
jgi:hypothetical protein